MICVSIADEHTYTQTHRQTELYDIRLILNFQDLLVFADIVKQINDQSLKCRFSTYFNFVLHCSIVFDFFILTVQMEVKFL